MEERTRLRTHPLVYNCPMESSFYTRRDFLGGAASVAMSARSYAQTAGANNKIRMAIIGCGGMADGHMRNLVKMKETDGVEIVAVCDLFEKRAQKFAGYIKENAGDSPKIIKDYRNVLADKDVEYVLITTPEHWHAQMTIDAAAAGKHVYCEKPMTLNVEQAKRVVAAVKKAGIKMQVGVQGMSDESYQVANQYIKDGYIGKVLLAQIDYSRNSLKPDYMYTKEDPDLKPSDIDWAAWQGTAPKHPFDAQRYFHWRRFWDYSSGIASDLFIHRVTRILKSCGLTFPERGVGTGGKFCWPDAIGDVPDTLNFLLDYPEGMTVQLVSSMGNSATIEHMIRGHKGTIYFHGKGFTIKPEKLFADEVKPVEYEKKGAENTLLHHRNLQAAIRSNAKLNCDVDLGYYGVVAAQIGSMSYRTRKYMMWDKAKERIVKA